MLCWGFSCKNVILKQTIRTQQPNICLFKPTQTVFYSSSSSVRLFTSCLRTSHALLELISRFRAEHSPPLVSAAQHKLLLTPRRTKHVNDARSNALLRNVGAHQQNIEATKSHKNLLFKK